MLDPLLHGIVEVKGGLASRFSEAIFTVLTEGGSDHSPILFLANPTIPKQPQPFRLYRMWFAFC